MSNAESASKYGELAAYEEEAVTKLASYQEETERMITDIGHEIRRQLGCPEDRFFVELVRVEFADGRIPPVLDHDGGRRFKTVLHVGKEGGVTHQWRLYRERQIWRMAQIVEGPNAKNNQPTPYALPGSLTEELVQVVKFIYEAARSEISRRNFESRW